MVFLQGVVVVRGGRQPAFVLRLAPHKILADFLKLSIEYQYHSSYVRQTESSKTGIREKSASRCVKQGGAYPRSRCLCCRATGDPGAVCSRGQSTPTMVKLEMW
jgi:hypothetical protein